VSDARFAGTIAGIGSAGGLRVVVGRWEQSPLGEFADVMVERPDGTRVLLAPSAETAEFVAGTYTFDDVRIVPVTATIDDTTWTVAAGPLSLVLRIGRRTALGVVLRLVPVRLATAPRWIGLIDAIARRVLPGVRTRGSAGNGREEYYGALDVHAIVAAQLTWEGVDQGGLVPVDPPVRFGFGSTPRRPSVVRVVTVVRTT
jgi:hypothetical protein